MQVIGPCFFPCLHWQFGREQTVRRSRMDPWTICDSNRSSFNNADRSSINCSCSLVMRIISHVLYDIQANPNTKKSRSLLPIHERIKHTNIFSRIRVAQSGAAVAFCGPSVAESVTLTVLFPPWVAFDELRFSPDKRNRNSKKWFPVNYPFFFDFKRSLLTTRCRRYRLAYPPRGSLWLVCLTSESHSDTFARHETSTGSHKS